MQVKWNPTTQKQVSGESSIEQTSAKPAIMVRQVRHVSDGTKEIGLTLNNAVDVRDRIHGEGEDRENEDEVEGELHDDL